jgi:D-alanyl-D-alanine carboxypeptidase
MKKFFIILFVSAFAGIAQSIDTKKLDAYFDLAAKYDQFYGGSAIIRNDSILYQNAIGYSNKEKSIKNASHTKYRVGSISKMFTSVLVFKAMEEGKLTLDSSLKSFYPEITNADSITIKHLLNHSSGIFNFTNLPEYNSYHTTKKTKEELLALLNGLSSEFVPGTKSGYSNSNYILLTFILEDVYKDSYASILKKFISTPLELSNTYVGSSINSDSGEAFSYVYDSDWKLSSETNMSIPLGAGAVVSTPQDLLTFISALFNYKLISKKSLEQMTSLKENYGHGIFSFPYKNHIGFGHTGGIDGFRSVLVYFPKENIGIATTSNAIGANFEFNNLSLALLKTAFGDSFELPNFEEVVVSSEILQSYAGTYKSKELPLAIEIKEVEGKLSAQATGQSSFLLKADSENSFSFAPAGIVLKFPAENEMILFQAGQTFNFKKE